MMKRAGKLSIVIAGLCATQAIGSSGARRSTQPAESMGSPAYWFGPREYPQAAMRASEQGRVAFRAEIDSEGRPTSCAVTGSSGSATLDHATCEILMAHGTFHPARDASGKGTIGTWVGSVKWAIPSNTESDSGTRITFAGSGDSIVCHASLHGKPLADWTPDACRQLVAAARAGSGSASLPPYVIMTQDPASTPPSTAPR